MKGLVYGDGLAIRILTAADLGLPVSNIETAKSYFETRVNGKIGFIEVAKIGSFEASAREAVQLINDLNSFDKAKEIADGYINKLEAL